MQYFKWKLLINIGRININRVEDVSGFFCLQLSLVDERFFWTSGCIRTPAAEYVHRSFLIRALATLSKACYLRTLSSAKYIYIYIYIYTGCPRRKGPNFGRVFLRWNYIDITQNTYIQSSMVTEISAREVWNFDSCYSLTDYQIHIETGTNIWFL